MLCVISAPCWIEAQAYGGNSNGQNRYAYVTLNGVAVWQASWLGEFPRHRGANVIIVDPSSCTLQEWRNFDTYASAPGDSGLSTYLGGLSDGTVLVGVSCDDASSQLYAAAATLSTLGVDVSDVTYRGAWVFVAEKGDPAKTVLDKRLTETASNVRQPQVSVSLGGV